jgi:hypothetical protein
MCRGIVEVEIILLDIFAVVALAVGQAEETLLQDWVPAIPERHAKAQPLLIIADTGQTVLTPAIRA